LRLDSDEGVVILFTEGGWRELPAGVAVDATGVNIELAGAVRRDSLPNVRHDFRIARRQLARKHPLTPITNCNSIIAGSNMTLGEKIRYLREVEGVLRGLGREMTQSEIARAVKKEQKKAISQSYLSQIENGTRPHLTDSTRMLLAKFFKVHPGYLVNDPEGFHTELMSDVRASEDTLDLWLINGAERFQRDPRVSRALLNLARHEDTRRCLILVDAILEVPDLADRLLHVLKPSGADNGRQSYELV
jgi:transcriptional regulator with XRE-family HTH domain